jgi:hypothetical protein
MEEENAKFLAIVTSLAGEPHHEFFATASAFLFGGHSYLCCTKEFMMAGEPHSAFLATARDPISLAGSRVTNRHQ